jgi:hypothetical protein
MLDVDQFVIVDPFSGVNLTVDLVPDEKGLLELALQFCTPLPFSHSHPCARQSAALECVWSFFHDCWSSLMVLWVDVQHGSCVKRTSDKNVTVLSVVSFCSTMMLGLLLPRHRQRGSDIPSGHKLQAARCHKGVFGHHTTRS